VSDVIPKPPWLKVKLPGGGRYYDVRKRLSKHGLHTVCEEARCPNAAECWGGGTATFIILGDRCTRGCRFCAVRSSATPGPPDPTEPSSIAAAALEMGLRYVVLTMVTRDDLPLGGAEHLAATVSAVADASPGGLVEVLASDFGGEQRALEVIANSPAAVLGHNLETTRGLTPLVRHPGCSYDRSLAVLAKFRELAGPRLTKSSLLLGLGETEDEITRSLSDMREVGVDWVAMGQYLRPTRRHAPVRRYLEPALFDKLGEQAREMGFALVSSGPLVRSSYRAGESAAKRILEERGWSPTSTVVTGCEEQTPER